jgi:hypothetical protein
MSELSLLSGVNQTSLLRPPTSEFDPFRTSEGPHKSAQELPHNSLGAIDSTGARAWDSVIWEDWELRKRLIVCVFATLTSWSDCNASFLPDVNVGDPLPKRSQSILTFKRLALPVA